MANTPAAPNTYVEKDKSGPLSIDKVTPELAAQIVKHFVLPMFDNAPSSNYGKKLGQKGIAQSGAVYGELKLSQQLTDQLSVIRDEVSTITERLEQEQQLRIKSQANLRDLNKKYTMKSKAHEILKTQHHDQLRFNQMFQEHVKKLELDNEALKKLSNQNEGLRKRLSQDLQASEARNDEQLNFIGCQE